MIPKSGSFSMNTVNVELGYSSTAYCNVSGRLSEMGETANPDSMGEMRGYDIDWDNGSQGWIDGLDTTTGNPIVGRSFIVKMKARNNSQDHSYSATMYWRIELNGFTYNSGSFATGTLATNGLSSEQTLESFAGDEYSDGDSVTLKARTSTSQSYKTLHTWFVTT